jgi:hypothetical protein
MQALIDSADRITRAREIADSALRLDNDVNGNPRYYIPVYMFTDSSGRMTRPAGAVKYRGKRYGAGWVFQSYSLENDIRYSLERMESAR